MNAVDRGSGEQRRAVGPFAPAQLQRAPVLRDVGRGRLEMRGVDKGFNGTETLVLQDISLTVASGEFMVVVGPSGCGKTTLLNLAGGMVKADGGEVLLDGKPVDGPGPERAMVFQDHGLFPWLTAAQNIGFGLRMAGMSRAERKDRVAEALRTVHLSSSGEKLVHELSGGMKQRVAIARALVMDPAVLLMDEPFAAVDAQTRTLLHAQLQELWCATKKTILFVTHSVGEAVRLADRIIVLSAQPGRIGREVRVELSHPRDFDSPQISELVKLVRTEIEDEVNRVNRKMAGDFWKPAAAADLGVDPHDMGGGI